MEPYVLVVAFISTLNFVDGVKADLQKSHVNFQEFSSAETCGKAMEQLKQKLPGVDISCLKK